MPFELRSDEDYSNVISVYNTGDRNEAEKIIDNKIKKNPLDPLLLIKHPKTQSEKYGGGGKGGSGPQAPLSLLTKRMIAVANVYLRSPKGGCCSISDDLSCFHRNLWEYQTR